MLIAACAAAFPSSSPVRSTPARSPRAARAFVARHAQVKLPAMAGESAETMGAFVERVRTGGRGSAYTLGVALPDAVAGSSRLPTTPSRAWGPPQLWFGAGGDPKEPVTELHRDLANGMLGHVYAASGSSSSRPTTRRALRARQLLLVSSVLLGGAAPAGLRALPEAQRDDADRGRAPARRPARAAPGLVHSQRVLARRDDDVGELLPLLEGLSQMPGEGRYLPQFIWSAEAGASGRPRAARGSAAPRPASRCRGRPPSPSSRAAR